MFYSMIFIFFLFAKACYMHKKAEAMIFPQTSDDGSITPMFHVRPHLANRFLNY